MEKKKKKKCLILPCVYDFRTGGNNSFTRITFLRSLMFSPSKTINIYFRIKNAFKNVENKEKKLKN